MKKLIPAICMTLIAAFMLASSTFAWFSMNETVTANGMSVSANSDATYLIVSNENTGSVAPENAAAIQAENTNKGFTSVNLTAAAKEVYPIAHNETAGTGVTSFTWYKMTSKDPTKPDGDPDTKQTIGDLGNYVLSYKLYFTVAKGANPAQNLIVTSCTITGDTALRCLVVGEANSHEYNATSEADSAVLAATITDETVVSVTIYVFYDGNHSTIYTNNKNILDGTISLTFSVTAGAAA